MFDVTLTGGYCVESFRLRTQFDYYPRNDAMKFFFIVDAMVATMLLQCSITDTEGETLRASGREREIHSSVMQGD